MAAYNQRVDKGLCCHCVNQHSTPHKAKHLLVKSVTLFVFLWAVGQRYAMMGPALPANAAKTAFVETTTAARSGGCFNDSMNRRKHASSRSCCSGCYTMMHFHRQLAAPGTPQITVFGLCCIHGECDIA